MFKQRGILDYCPICGAMLNDDLIETRCRHDEQEHPECVKIQRGKDDVE